MVQRSEVDAVDAVQLKCNRLEAEIDRDLTYQWPLFKRQRVAYRYEVRGVQAKEVAVELQKRYRKGGFHVDLLYYADEAGRWYAVDLEFKGEGE